MGVNYIALASIPSWALALAPSLTLKVLDLEIQDAQALFNLLDDGDGGVSLSTSRTLMDTATQ